MTNIRNKVLKNITLAKIGGAIFTALLLTFFKYCILGQINIEPE
jgi:hypothetical protein